MRTFQLSDIPKYLLDECGRPVTGPFVRIVIDIHMTCPVCDDSGTYVKGLLCVETGTVISDKLVPLECCGVQETTIVWVEGFPGEVNDALYEGTLANYPDFDGQDAHSADYSFGDMPEREGCETPVGTQVTGFSVAKEVRETIKGLHLLEDLYDPSTVAEWLHRDSPFFDLDVTLSSII